MLVRDLEQQNNPAIEGITPHSQSAPVSPAQLSVMDWEERAAEDNIRTFVSFLVHNHYCEVAEPSYLNQEWQPNAVVQKG